jgi:NTE family protein/lysophospholipid hydrolase
MTSQDSSVAELVAGLRSNEIFGSLTNEALQELGARMALVRLQDGDLLMAQGNPSDALYIVLSGVLEVGSIEPDDTAPGARELGPGTGLGEMNVLSGGPAPATCRARGPVVVAALSREAFNRFTEACPRGGLDLMDRLRPRLQRQRLRSALKASDMFRHVEPEILADLEAELEIVSRYGGETLFRQGESGDSLYIVVTGRLRVVSIEPDNTERLLAELGTGETVGEMGVISGEARSATVYATRDTELAKLSKASVDRLFDRHPRAMLPLLTSRLVARVRDMSRADRKRTAIATIAVIPAGPGVPLAEFTAGLSAALSRLGPTSLLTSDVVDAGLGRPGAAQAHDRDGGGSGLVEWLARQEGEYRYLVYQANQGLSPWTERCLRQADRLVLVADASADPAPGDIEAELLAATPAPRTPVILAIVHPGGTSAPSNTARWHAGRTIQRHLHVRRGESSHYERLARFMTGTATGLTLGGGFARGIAHLGVFRALGEMGIPVDAVGGSSMGALVGALWALEWPSSRIVDELRTGLADSFDDMTIPFLAFKRGGKHSQFIRRLFQDIRIEDLWTPFFCVSANLNRAELKIHTRGRLADAVIATTRAPGIFPPMVIEGELHVDGGLINNVPVDIMKEFTNEGVVIGVDVSPPHELNEIDNYGDDVSGWRAIWHRFNPKPERRVYRPSLLLVLMRAIEFGGISYRRAKAELADIYIAPDVLKFKRSDFAAAADIAQAGYDASRTGLVEWLAAAPESLRTRRPDLFAGRDAGASIGSRPASR